MVRVGGEDHVPEGVPSFAIDPNSDRDAGLMAGKSVECSITLPQTHLSVRG